MIEVPSDNPDKTSRGFRWRHLLRISFGVLFLILGFFGLFLPLLQGVFFIVVGVAMLADYIPVFARIRNAVYRRYPRAEHMVLSIRSRLKKFHTKH